MADPYMCIRSKMNQRRFSRHLNDKRTLTFIIFPVAKWRHIIANHFSFKHSHSLSLAFVHYTVHFISFLEISHLWLLLSKTQYTVTQLIATRERKTETVSFTAGPHRNCKDRGFIRRLYTKEQDTLNTAITVWTDTFEAFTLPFTKK